MKLKLQDIQMSNKNEPHVLDIKKDKNYAWCQCNESEGQPFCDGRHSKTDHQPIVFKSDASKEVALCGCKQSKNAPYCDGTHLSL